MVDETDIGRHSHTYPNTHTHTYNGILRPAPVTVTWYPNPKLMIAVW